MSPTIGGSSEWSDEILREIFRHTPVGVVLSDLHGTILDVNTAFCEVIGYPRDLILGRPAASFIHPDDVAKAEAFLGRLREGETGSRRAVHRLQARNGKAVWVNTTVSVVRSAENEPICGIAFIEDIGDRLEMEKALRDSESLYRQVVEDQTEMIVRTNANGIRTFANAAYAKYFGLRDHDVIGTSFFPLVAEEDRAAVKAQIAALTPANPAGGTTHRVIVANGSLRWTEWTNLATFDDGGNLATLQSIGRDVTERVEAIDALRTSELRHRRLLGDLPIAVWESDWTETVAFIRRQGIDSPEQMLATASEHPELVIEALRQTRIVEMNRAALDLVGVSDRQAFSAWIPTAWTPASFEQLLRGIAPLVFGELQTSRAELQLRVASGEMRDVLFQWGRVRRDNDWRVINTVLDVTERKKFEREIVQRGKRLEEAEAIAHLGSWELDLEDNSLSGSEEFWHTYDGASGGSSRRSLEDVVAHAHPADGSEIIDLFRRLGSNEFAPLPRGREWRIVRPDGSVRSVRVHAVAERSSDGRLTRLHGTMQDITEQKLAAAALERSETMYRSLFHNLPFAVWEADWSEMVQRFKTEGVRNSKELLARLTPDLIRELIDRRPILEVNQHALDLFGVPDAATFSRASFFAIDPQYRAEAARLVAEILWDERTHGRTEFQVMRPDGTAADVEVVVAANPVAKGRVTTAVRNITERKQFERELLRSEQTYRSLFHNLPVAVWESDWSEALAAWSARGIHTSAELLARLPEEEIGRYFSTRRILEVNELALKLFGIKDAEAFAGQTWDSLHPEHRSRVTKVFVTVLFAERPSTGAELQLIRPDGSVVDIEVVFAANPAGVGRVTTAVMDVTERKRAEEALRQSEARYRLLFHNLPVAVWETDWSGALERWNSAGLDTAEGAASWLRGGDRTTEELASLRTLLEANQNAMAIAGAKDIESFRTWALRAVRKEDIDRVVPKIASVVLGLEATVRVEFQTQRCDGTPMDLDMQLAAQEGFPGRVISTAIDVTEKRRIERELLQSQILLESAQAIAHTGSWEVNLDTDELFGSREYWNIFDGHENGPRRRRFTESLLHVPPEERIAVMRLMEAGRSALLTGRPEEALIEFRVVRDDGSMRLVRGRGVFARTPSGEVRGYGVMQDITEQRKAEEAAQQQREELLRADRMISLGILVSGVAHEINNPNHFIMLNAPLLRNAWSDLAPILDEHAQEAGTFKVANLPWSEMRTEIPEIIDEIAVGAERIRAIVSELRAFGRDHDPGTRKPEAINDIVRGSLRLLSNHIRKATMSFSIDLAADLPLVSANSGRLEQVIINLVLNSCQALQRRDAAIRVVTSLDRGHDRVEVRVIDEGCGIAPDDLKNIRDPFFTTKRGEGGMGLGLAVSDRIVQEHNGTLTFESDPRRGTTAILSIPAARE